MAETWNAIDSITKSSSTSRIIQGNFGGQIRCIITIIINGIFVTCSNALKTFSVGSEANDLPYDGVMEVVMKQAQESLVSAIIMSMPR